MNETSHDEKETNLDWLEDAYIHFCEALERKDWASAQAVIEDCKGFDSAVKVMKYELVKAQSGHLAATKSIV